MTTELTSLINFLSQNEYEMNSVLKVCEHC